MNMPGNHSPSIWLLAIGRDGSGLDYMHGSHSVPAVQRGRRSICAVSRTRVCRFAELTPGVRFGLTAAEGRA